MSNPGPLLEVFAFMGASTIAGGAAGVYGAGILAAGATTGVITAAIIGGAALGAVAGLATSFLALRTLSKMSDAYYRWQSDRKYPPAATPDNLSAKPVSGLKKLTGLFSRRAAQIAPAQPLTPEKELKAPKPD